MRLCGVGQPAEDLLNVDPADLQRRGISLNTWGGFLAFLGGFAIIGGVIAAVLVGLHTSPSGCYDFGAGPSCTSKEYDRIPLAVACGVSGIISGLLMVVCGLTAVGVGHLLVDAALRTPDDE